MEEDGNAFLIIFSISFTVESTEKIDRSSLFFVWWWTSDSYVRFSFSIRHQYLSAWFDYQHMGHYHRLSSGESNSLSQWQISFNRIRNERTNENDDDELHAEQRNSRMDQQLVHFCFHVYSAWSNCSLERMTSRWSFIDSFRSNYFDVLMKRHSFLSSSSFFSLSLKIFLHKKYK